MSIEKSKKSGKYRARVGSRSDRITSPYFPLKKQAVAWEAEMRSRALKRELGHEEPETLISEATDEFIGSLRGRTMRHQREVRRSIEEFAEEYHLTEIGDLNVRDVERLKRTSHLGISSLKRKVIYLKAFAKFLVLVEYIKTSPLEKVKLPIGKTKEKRALDVDELYSLLLAIERHAPSIYEACFLIAHCGLRKNEALTLEWKDVKFDQRILTLRNKPHILVDGEPFYCKWGSQRVVPLAEPVLLQLKKLKISASTNWVFPNEEGNMIRNNVNRNFNRARVNAGIERPEEVTPHTLRHTWISQLLSNGVDLIAVSQLAGHSNLTTTQGYAHLLGGVEKLHFDIAKLPDFTKKCASNLPADFS